MYLVRIQRDTKNAPNGRAQYRVKYCVRKWYDGFFSCFNIPAIRASEVEENSVGLYIETNKPYRTGNLINPTKALRYAMRVKV